MLSLINSVIKMLVNWFKNNYMLKIYVLIKAGKLVGFFCPWWAQAAER